jgi:hypothetical protein
MTRLSASPTSWLRRFQLVSPALRTLRDAWRLAKGGAGSDDAYTRGIAQIGARRPRKPFPTMPWEQRRRPGSSRNTGTFLSLFVASYPRRGVILPGHLRPCLFKIAQSPRLPGGRNTDAASQTRCSIQFCTNRVPNVATRGLHLCDSKVAVTAL